MATEPLRIFAVVSWGCAGTHWLAEALDSHPELRCFHNLNGKIARVGGGRLDGVDYARLLETQDLGHRAVGDVHGFARTTMAEVREAFGDRFRCAILVRDPLPRFRSQLALFRENGRKTGGRRPWDIEYVKPLARAAGIERAPDDYEAWLVVHGANMLNMILEEREIAPVVRMEDVVADPDALSSLVSALTGGAVAADRAWASRAVSRPRVFSHANDRTELSAEEQDVLERMVKPATWQAYRELGYAC
jgi:hypothetical protein